MAKKKINKKVSKSKDIHFKHLNLNKKIISVILIVLAIGVIGSVFPGEGMTGGAIGDLILDTYKGVDSVVSQIVPQVGVEKIFIYEKFVLFLLLFALLSKAVGLINIKGITNAIVAGAISLISIWFIPISVLAMIGITYSSLYATLLILIPVIVIGVLAWQMPKSKPGYWWKAFSYGLLLIVFSATREGIVESYRTEWYNTFGDTIMLVLIILIVYCIYKALTMTSKESAKNYNDWKEKEATGKLVTVLDTKLVDLTSKAIEKKLENIGKGKEE